MLNAAASTDLRPKSEAMCGGQSNWNHAWKVSGLPIAKACLISPLKLFFPSPSEF